MEVLQSIWLERTGEQFPESRIEQYELLRIRSVLASTSKQQRRPKNYGRWLTGECLAT